MSKHRLLRSGPVRFTWGIPLPAILLMLAHNPASAGAETNPPPASTYSSGIASPAPATNETLSLIRAEGNSRLALRRDPLDQNTLSELLGIYQHGNDALMACITANFAAEIYPTNEFFASRKKELISSLQPRWRDEFPANDARVELEKISRLMRQAVEQGRHGSFTAVELRLRSLASRFPSDPDVLFRLGTLYYVSREWTMAAALNLYAAQHARAGRNIFIHNYVAAMENIHAADFALTFLKQRLQEKPDNPFLLAETARLAHRMGKTSECLRVTAKWTAAAPRDPTAWFTRGLVLYEDARLEDAESAFARAVRLPRPPAQAYAYLARLALQREDLEQAKSWFRKFTELRPPEEVRKALSSPPLDRLAPFFADAPAGRDSSHTPTAPAPRPED